MLDRFKKLIFRHDEVQRFQEEVSKTFNQITDIKYLDGTEIEVDLISGDTTIDHKLQREINGAILLSKSGLGDYYIKSTDSKRIVFTGDAAFTARFWVY